MTEQRPWFVLKVAACTLATATLVAACYRPIIGDGTLSCPDGVCPRGFHCGEVDHVCWHMPDAGNETDDGGTAARTGQDNDGGGGGGGGVGAVDGGDARDGADGAAGSPAGGTGGAPVGGAGGHAGAGGSPGTGGTGTGAGGNPGTGGRVTGAGGQTGPGTGGATGTGGNPGPGVGGGTGTGTGGATGAGGRAGIGGGPGIDGGTDVPRDTPPLPLGAACGDATMCASGFCTDGVCCARACDGQCEACDLGPSPGQCTAVVAGPPRGTTRAPCAGSGVCAGVCALTSPTATTAACRSPGSERACGSPSCTGNLLTPAATCDGLGGCRQPTAASPCPFGLRCSVDQVTCLAGCVSADDCISATPFCDPSNSRCTAARPIGSSCGANSDCQNGQCVDRFCCDDPCAGQCQACDIMGREGRCSLVTAGQPHGTTRVSCAGTGECRGSCDGTSTACRSPGAETACTCSPPLSLTGSCDGNGNCQMLGLGICL